MLRTIEVDLLSWKSHPNRKPLLVRGARQVGKSYTVEKFGREHFQNLVVVNFEFEPRYIACFDTLDPLKIIRAIEILSQQTIEAGKTLLFLDEIQDCPKAILALRYFKEKMPELHVIGAGSLLEFALNSPEFRKPVGRISSLYMKPCSFKEFLLAMDSQKLLDYLSEVTPQSGVEQPYHELLLERCREYFWVGGMPEALNIFVNDHKFNSIQPIHAEILEFYQKDFTKYHHKVNFRILQKIFAKAPSLIAKHFKFSAVDPDIQARDQRPILDSLFQAGVFYPVYLSKASLPLHATRNDKKFKLLFLDVGLAHHATHLQPEVVLQQELMLINQGALAEQFVGQELLAYSPNYEMPELYYWEREKQSSEAEIDYLVILDSKILPIEVKAGKTGRMRSMQLFLEEKKLPFGVRISEYPLSFEQNILSVPFYLVHELARLVKSI